MADHIKCVSCGRFMGESDFDGGHCHFEPLNEFGPEVLEWTCAGCVEKERRADEEWATRQPSTGPGWLG